MMDRYTLLLLKENGIGGPIGGGCSSGAVTASAAEKNARLVAPVVAACVAIVTATGGGVGGAHLPHGMLRHAVGLRLEYVAGHGEGVVVVPHSDRLLPYARGRSPSPA